MTTAPIDLRGTVTEMASSANRTWYIYCHTAPNGKRYIGQTCQEPEKRWARGYGYKGQQHFKRAIDKYGWDNFKHVVLCTVSSKENADFLEQWFIEKWDTFNPEHGYNHTKGGGGTLGYHMSDSNRKKLSQANSNREWTDKQRKQIGDTLREGYASGRIAKPSMSDDARKRMSKERTGSGNPMYGRHHTEEAARRIKEFHTGRKRSDETKRKISEARYASEKIPRRAVNQYTPDGVLVAQYRSIKEASIATDTVSQQIRGCCTHLHWQAKGFLWRYQDQPETFPAQQMGLSF